MEMLLDSALGYTGASKQRSGDMADASVHEYVDAAIADKIIERNQVKNAGRIIAQFLQVRKGLERRETNLETLDVIAATLTAAIWARGDK